MVYYDKLWHLLIDKNINKTILCEKTKISSSTIIVTNDTKVTPFSFVLIIILLDIELFTRLASLKLLAGVL